MSVQILTGDCRDILPTLPGNSVQCVVTSPPYFGLRDYGTAQWDGGDPECGHSERAGQTVNLAKSVYSTRGGAKKIAETPDIQYRDTCGKCGAVRIDAQIGLEPTVDAYVAELVAVFREVRRVLRDDGVLWLNLGDSYNAQPGQRKTTDKAGPKQMSNTASPDAPSRFDPTLKPKDLIGVPWRVAFALQADGWWLRQDVIWSKLNPMPESVTDRCTKAHEYLFLLTKSARYYYDAKAIAEPTTWDLATSKMPDGWDTGSGGHGSFHRNGREKGAPASHRGSRLDHGKTADHQMGRAQSGPRFGGAKYGDSDDPLYATKSGNVYTGQETRNKRSVWTIATQPYSDAHFATYPEALVEPCILAGSREGDTILDPFGGSGTTGRVATRLNRRAILIELNPEYIGLIEKRTAQRGLDFAGLEVPA